MSSEQRPLLQAEHLFLPRSPRLAEVVRALAEQIRSGQYLPGQQLPPIRDIAQQHSLSFGSARAAVACLERAGLVESLQGSGTFVRHATPPVASPAAKGARTPWVALFTDDRLHVGGVMSVNIARLLTNAGIMSSMSYWHQNMSDQDLLNQCLWGESGYEPRAIVLQGGDTRRDELIRSFARQRNVRVITLLRLPETVDPQWHTVTPDYYGAYQLAARELITRGHRRIGVLTKQRVVASFWVHTARKNLMLETRGPLAVGRALRDAGIRSGLSIHYNLRVNTDPSGFPQDEPNLVRMTQWLGSPQRPTAVITDDYRVPGLVQSARRAGLRVPEDLAVVAVCGALPAQMFDCPCVSLRYDVLAQRVADLVLMDQEILGPTPRHLVVSANWVAQGHFKG